MREVEAIWIGERLAEIGADELSPVVNLGSSTEKQRKLQSHTVAHIWGPLERRGVKVIHVDLKEDKGVDIVGNIFDPHTRYAIRKHSPKTLLCCNMLEHVEDPLKLARACSQIGALNVVVSVPYSYPYHRDPIDTMFRPNLETLAHLFADFKLANGTIVRDLNAWQEMRKNHNIRWILRYFTKSLALFIPMFIFDRDKFKARYHRFFWMFRPYKVTCAVFVNFSANLPK